MTYLSINFYLTLLIQFGFGYIATYTYAAGMVDFDARELQDTLVRDDDLHQDMGKSLCPVDWFFRMLYTKNRTHVVTYTKFVGCFHTLTHLTVQMLAPRLRAGSSPVSGLIAIQSNKLFDLLIVHAVIAFPLSAT